MKLLLIVTITSMFGSWVTLVESTKRETPFFQPLIKRAIEIFGNINRISSTGRKSTPEIVLHPERVQLLHDAFSCLTIRKRGIPLDQSESEPFLNSILRKYKESKYYRTVVIAFQLGVLPKLTLNEGDDCNPSYTSAYRDPFNNSVTDHSIKNFTFISYYTRNNPNSFLPTAYCDYRKGLICDQTTAKCQCPKGSKMSPLIPHIGHKKQRCLLEKNQICSLIDLEYSTTHEMLQGHLPYMIFNLEKPAGCQNDLQCRFSKTNPDIPKCLETNSTGEFIVGDANLELGRKCGLNVYTDNGGGMCDFSSSNEKLTCWDFGPRSHPNFPENVGKIGYCAGEHGEFIGNGVGGRIVKNNGRIMDFQPFVIPFVNPRTVPWPSNNDFNSFKIYLGKDATSGLQALVQKYFQVVQSDEEGVCSVDKTRRMEKVWRFYEGLEQKQLRYNPLPQSEAKNLVPESTTHRSDSDDFNSSVNDKFSAAELRTNHFSASAVDLEVTMKEALMLVQGPEKICRVYKNIERPGGLTDNIGCALTCKAIGTSADPNGNDGHCEDVPFDETTVSAERVKDFLDHDFRVRDALASEEANVDTNILAENPESGCDPTIGPYGDSNVIKAEVRHSYVEYTAGQECSSKSVCVENLSDNLGIYIESTCELIPAYQPQTMCHDISSAAALGKCERILLEKKVAQALDDLIEHSKLGRGAMCNYNIEKRLRQAIIDQNIMNGYMTLNLITVGKAQGGFCDPTRLLECTDNDKCECVKDTEPRVLGHRYESNGNNTFYASDHCYLSTGSCQTDVTKLVVASTLQKLEIQVHYSSVEEIAEDCTNGNVCKFLDYESRLCTKINTEKTGLEGGKITPYGKLGAPQPQFISGKKSIVISCPVEMSVLQITCFVTIYFRKIISTS